MVECVVKRMMIMIYKLILVYFFGMDLFVERKWRCIVLYGICLGIFFRVNKLLEIYRN